MKQYSNQDEYKYKFTYNTSLAINCVISSFGTSL